MTRIQAHVLRLKPGTLTTELSRHFHYNDIFTIPKLIYDYCNLGSITSLT